MASKLEVQQFLKVKRVQMERMIECGLCDGKARLNIELKERVFRKENFFIYEHYYKCNSCKQEFTTGETDDLNVAQEYNQYREKHQILFPEQITAVSK